MIAIAITPPLLAAPLLDGGRASAGARSGRPLASAWCACDAKSSRRGALRKQGRPPGQESVGVDIQNPIQSNPKPSPPLHFLCAASAVDDGKDDDNSRDRDAASPARTPPSPSLAAAQASKQEAEMRWLECVVGRQALGWLAGGRTDE